MTSNESTVAAITAIWEELLGVDDLTDDDDFFVLGGNSQKALWLVARVRDRFGVDLPLSSVYAAPTLAGFAGTVDATTAATVARPPAEAITLTRRRG